MLIVTRTAWGRQVRAVDRVTKKSVNNVRRKQKAILSVSDALALFGFQSQFD